MENSHPPVPHLLPQEEHHSHQLLLRSVRLQHQLLNRRLQLVSFPLLSILLHGLSSKRIMFFYVTFCWLHTLRILCYIILTLTILGLTIMSLLTWNIFRRRPACRGPTPLRLHNIIWRNIFCNSLSKQFVCRHGLSRCRRTRLKCLLREAQASRYAMVYLEYWKKESIP